MGKTQIRNLKNKFLLLFVFSIPFEYWDPFGIASFFTVTKIAGFAYAGIGFLMIRQSFDPRVYRSVQYLLVFWFLLVMLSMFNYTGNNTVSIFNFTLLQNIILYWLIASDLQNKNIQPKYVFLAFVLSIILMSGLLAIGVGISHEYIEGSSRITFFENNSNTVGVLSGLAIVFSIYFTINSSQNFGKKGFLILLALPSFFNMLLLSGSRGALITVAFSVSVMLIMNKGVPYKKMLQIAILIVATIIFLDRLSESELMYKRMTQFIEEGDTAGRGEIWEDVLEIAVNRPFLGYGATGFENEMSKVYGARRDSHNLFLYILVTTGIVGLSIFFCFLYPHLKYALQDLKKGNILKIVLFVFYLTTVIKSGGAINNKLMWLILAIILSASFYIDPQKKILIK